MLTVPEDKTTTTELELAELLWDSWRAVDPTHMKP